MAKASKTPLKKSIFTLETGNKKKLPVVAAVEGCDMQDIVNRSLAEYFDRWEKKNGKIPVK